MNFLILSDSHRNRGNIVRAKEKCGRVDAVLFLGDGLCDFDDENRFMGTPLFSVRGNCDAFSFGAHAGTPEELLLSFEGYRIFMMHGHRFDVKYSLDRAVAYAVQKGADILLFGHTHTPIEKYVGTGESVGSVILDKPLYVFNPGSIGQRYEGGYFFGTLNIAPNGILFGHGKF